MSPRPCTAGRRHTGLAQPWRILMTRVRRWKSSFVLCAALLAVPGTGIAQTQISPGQMTAAPDSGGLGDLSAFRVIVADTLRIVKIGDLSGAKNRIKDLETAWDDAEEKLRPRNREKWKRIDKAIDGALAKLRAGRPEATACAEELQSLIVLIDTIEKKG
jgi:hypothetical protein